MSYSFHAPSGRTYFHDGGTSGTFDFYADIDELPGEAEGQLKLSLPKEDVIAMASEMIRSQMISFAEIASDDQIMKYFGMFLSSSGRSLDKG